MRNYNATLVNQHASINTFDVEFTIIMSKLKFKSLYYGWEWVHRQWLNSNLTIVCGPIRGFRTEKNFGIAAIHYPIKSIRTPLNIHVLIVPFID